MDELPGPDESLGHNIRGTFRAMETLVVRALATINLRYSHFQVLYVLFHVDGCTQGEIARASFITDTSLAQVLHEMEAAGLVERRRDSLDGRKRLVYLTPKGRAAKEPASRAVLEVMNPALQGLSEDDIARYVETSIRIRKNIQFLLK